MTILDTSYLKDNGDSLNFESADSFYRRINGLDLSVPPRSLGRKSYHRERFCVLFYLKGLIVNSLIEFPLTVTKSESPDFILKIGNGTSVAIEQRDITTTEYQKNLSTLSKEKTNKPILLDPSYLKSSPTDEINTKWVQLALEAISDKIITLNKPHFQSLDSYELLLYSNTDLPNINKNEVIPLLGKAVNDKYQETTFKKNFRSISIIYGDEVWLRALCLNNKA